MAASNIYSEATVTSARELLKGLDLSADSWQPGAARAWIFRGVGGASYELVPKAHRLKPTDEIAEYRFLKTSTISGSRSWSQQVAMEFLLLWEFVEALDAQGLPAPEGLARFRMSENWWRLMEASLGRGVPWPPEELLSMLAIAQHYGLPTRLLDWSVNPLTSAYMAAIDVVKTAKEKREEFFAIWALNRLAIQERWPSKDIDRCKAYVFHPPRSENPNLAAQEGLFTVDMTLRKSDLSAPFHVEPLEKVVREGFRNYDFSNVGIKGPVLKKFKVPVNYAPEVLRLLADSGKSAGRLMPGYKGAAEAVKEMAFWDQVPFSYRLK